MAAGLSLHDLGAAMSPERPGLPSPLHAAVKTAVQVNHLVRCVALPPLLVIPPSPPFVCTL